jgi:hypothetical protein
MRIGEVHLHPVPDGTFVARPRYFGDHLTGRHHPEVFDRRGTARLPIGCFLIRTGDRLVLVDAGLGPERQDMPYGMRLVGGRLPAGLRALGVAPADLTDVICTCTVTTSAGSSTGTPARSSAGRRSGSAPATGPTSSPAPGS